MTSGVQQLIATPLRGWNLGEVELRPGVCLERASSLSGFDIQFFPSLSEHELERIRKREYWLTLVTDEPQNEAQCEAAQDHLLRCVEALQIVRPNGWDGIVVTNRLGEAKANGLTQFPSCEPTKWGRIVGFGTHQIDYIQSIVVSVERVYDEKIVRFQTPIQLLIEGLKSRHYFVSFLLWCVALDSLLIAERRDVFERRIIRFLGADSFVFPLGERGYQPPYKVGQLASDLYELRGFIAHGYEVPRKFRENIRFEMQDTVYPSGSVQWDYQYRQLLSDAALFLLCAVLRRIFELDLIELVKKSKRWKNHLDTLSPAAP